VQFIDQANIILKAGKGGNGIVSFRRDKFVPAGGPSGWNGGRGGSVILMADNNLQTLLDFKFKREIIAEDGCKGGPNKRSGASGEDRILKVPCGTEIRDINSGIILGDLIKDKESLELIEIIFPQFKNIKNYKKQNSYAAENFLKIDFIFLIALLVIDGTDNTDYFLYKFKISNKDKKRLKLIDLFYKEKVTLNNFTEKNLNKFFYFNGRQAVIDIINFKIFTSKKVEKKLIKLLDTYKQKVIPTLPIGADLLMSKFQIPEGKTLGTKLKKIEETWVQNGFQISDKQVQQIVKS